MSEVIMITENRLFSVFSDASTRRAFAKLSLNCSAKRHSEG